GIRVDPEQFPSGRPPSYQQPVLSADGNFIAFSSTDANLVPGERFEGGGRLPISSTYLYDVRTRRVTLVSHLAGQPAILRQNPSWNPVISADGRFIAYVSNVYGDQHSETVLYDRLLDTSTDITPHGIIEAGPSSNPSISDDGRYVTYENENNVYVFDRNRGLSTLV